MKKTLTFYKKKLDKVFSVYIRTKYSKNGTVKCYTCPHTGEIKKMQNGHFVPRQYLATRWDEGNCRPQCFACNIYYGGQGAIFAENLMKEYGKSIIAELNKTRTQIVKMTPRDYEEKIAYYEEKLSPTT